jgi:dynein intermediate chain 1
LQYWDDPADAVKPEEGTLLPLWGDKETASFTSPRVKRRAVTALAWSTRYFDLFAAGYGSFDFLNPTTGLVACYSLKSPGQPERSYRTAAGVMCLDFHPERSNLLAVGCYDGSLAIFDLRAGKRCSPAW